MISFGYRPHGSVELLFEHHVVLAVRVGAKDIDVNLISKRVVHEQIVPQLLLDSDGCAPEVSDRFML